MSEQIEALRYDLIRIMADLIQAEEDATALAAVRLISDRIDVALDEMEARRC
ncbi:hypothetical protein ACFWDG_27100 [Peribacillus sp. NPDC060186]